MTNVGKKPTFPENKITLETYIFDFNQEIYGKTIGIKFIQFLREEIYFDNKQDLIDRIMQDREDVLKLIEARLDINEKNQ
jgi:riboflavin kinase/FMN adenylyltransferase